MAVNKERYLDIRKELESRGVILVAVSKTKPAEDIKALYDLGHRDFGENYVQELEEKEKILPKDIRWHFIGHLQSNKVKYIAPFVHLIHGVDSLKLLKEISRQGEKNSRVIDILLQVHIAQEESKFGLDEKELEEILHTEEFGQLKGIRIRGLMGMATFTDDKQKIRTEFNILKTLFERFAKELRGFDILSMGMSSDYPLALEEGSTMVRIGSLVFGERG